MATSSIFTQIQEAYWQVSGGNIQRLNFIAYDTVYFVVNPTTLNGLGGTKTSVLTGSQLANFRSVYTAPNVVIPSAADFLVSNWSAKGWSTSSATAFAFDLCHFININFSNIQIPSYDLLLLFGTVSGQQYAVPLFYEGNRTSSVSPFLSATGGTVTFDGDFKVHTFTLGSNFVISGGISTVETLIVGGGGGGGYGGGGGAGGVIHQTGISLAAGSYPITVGTAGPGGGGQQGTNGGNSTFNGQTAVGGGYGGGWLQSVQSGNSGGSGGGGAGGQAFTAGGGGSPTAGQGFAGGSGYSPPISYFSGGGGGGAGGIGGNGITTGSGSYVANGGNGGNGLQFSISGIATYYAGGGGGSASGNGGSNPGSGGLGGGGNGGTSTGSNATGFGSGGGGGQSTGGNGSSGVVIIRYQYR